MGEDVRALESDSSRVGRVALARKARPERYLPPVTLFFGESSLLEMNHSTSTLRWGMLHTDSFGFIFPLPFT